MPLWMVAVEWLARLILLGLIGLSIWSVTIIVDRKKILELFDIKEFLKKLQSKANNYNRKDIFKCLNKQIAIFTIFNFSVVRFSIFV